MPGPTEGDIIEILAGASRDAGHPPLVASEAAALAAFCGLFLKWNARINLASVAGARELVERHVVDALAAARFVVAGDAVLDVGSGGGLPALPLALLVPGATFALHEPRTRRLAFLRTAVRELGLGDRVSLSGTRIEAGDPPPRGAAGQPQTDGFSVAMSRATWPPREWLAIGRRLVRPEGKVLVFATEALAAELPPPDASAGYSRGRRLCVFAAAERHED
jgi:16S rRNA (guanine527-N7)-methyltransferase